MSVSRQASRPSGGARRLQAMIAGYKPLPGVPDEFATAKGVPRKHWMRFLESLNELSGPEIERRFADCDQYLRDSGVSYRAWAEGAESMAAPEREWPLSHIPLVIPENEWQEIAAGVAQRAELLETILADIYGPGRLLAEGALPPAVITGSSEFLRPMHGVKPPGGRYLQLYAADIGRGPDGRWWVIGDRTQAPSGAGYALENRVALSRAFPELYRRMNVERLAPFFQSLRAGLAGLAERADPRICLLSPGMLSETYFEHAYLARYLGLLLVEGDDLTMRQNQIHVRTVAGLKRADVLLRRIDSNFADPLELNSASELGVPGLIEAVRAGTVAVANALGSGVLEAPALMGFIPGLARRVLGEDLLLPNIATWWCGQERERQEVLESLDDMAIGGAFGQPLPGFEGQGPVLGSSLDGEARERLAAMLGERGADVVGQEIVKLSTTPVWDNGKLVPRPFVMRVFATATQHGWRIMQGGFARISDQVDARAVSMRKGVLSADVWILADKPVEQTSLLPTGKNIRIRRIMGNLPSRAADNMYWLGRYVERAEATLRIVRALAAQLVEAGARESQGSVPQRLAHILMAWGALPAEKKPPAPSAATALAALESEAEYGSALRLARATRRAASVVRDRLSSDTWSLVGDLEACLVEEMPAASTEAEVFERARNALRVVAALSGLMHENMNRVAGWRFLEIGRRIERGVNACRFTRQFSSDDSPFAELDVLLELSDSQITYRQRYLAGLALAPVRDVVMLDPGNPRSAAFQVEQLVEHLNQLPPLHDDGMPEAPRRIIANLAGDIGSIEAAALDHATLLRYEQNLLALSDAVGARYFLQGPHAARGGKIMGLA